jgi:hypothetical protein
MQLFEHVNEIEAYKPPQMAHIDGALALLKQSVTYARQRPSHVRGILAGLRGIATFAAINRRTPIFLSEPTWTDLPFHGQKKTIREDLFDLGLCIPALLKFVDGWLLRVQGRWFDKQTFDSTCQNHLADVSTLRSEFEKWLLRLETTITGPLYWPLNEPPIQSMNISDRECKPKVVASSNRLQFPCGPIAGLLAQYWAFQLELLMISMDIHEASLKYTESPAVTKTASAELNAIRSSAEDTARLILEAQPYLFSCFEGLIALQPPLTVVTRYFQRNSV